MSLATETTQPISSKFQGRILRTFMLVVLPLAILPIIIIASIFVMRAKNIILEQFDIQLNANSDILANDIESWLTTGNIRLDAATHQPSLQEALDQALTPGFQETTEFAARREYILTTLQAINHKRGTVTFDDFLIVTPSGEVLISSNQQWEKSNIANTEYFRTLTEASDSLAYYAPKPLTSDQLVIFTHVPYQHKESSTAHILGILNPLKLQAVLESAVDYDPNISSYIITKNERFFDIDPHKGDLRILEPSADQTEKLLPLEAQNIPGSNNNQTKAISLRTFDHTQVIANYRWIPSLKTGLVIEIPETVVFQQLRSIIPFAIAILGFLVVFLGISLLLATRRLVGPIQTLTQTVQAFRQGDWDQHVAVKQNNEIGLLSYTFNQMAAELSNLYHSMETQVKERTNELQTRSSQFEATAQVARASAAIRDIDTLLINTTKLISQYFGFYHVGIFLLDENKRYAILQAANSEGGQQMLARGHKLRVGRTGVVGYVAETGLARIALDVGADRYFFDNPNLPETRSEAALALKIQNRVIGVLDVQSKESESFSEADTEVLQIMTDQISLAIENAHLLDEGQRTIRELQSLSGEYIHQTWGQYLGDQSKAYHYDRVRVAPASQHQITSMGAIQQNQIQMRKDSDGGQILTIPIVFRERSIGSIALRRDSDEPVWTSDDQELAQEVSIQIAVALENARLLEKFQDRVTREQLSREITEKMQLATDMDDLVQSTIQDISSALSASDVVLHLGTEAELQDRLNPSSLPGDNQQ
ncbi:MAG: GAF domain-containing protein [Chloroflexota bacterium]|nr:GAF domain-containing protein [Chloroflexota bacterium]